jgi:protoheme IX farnesyltransferase
LTETNGEPKIRPPTSMRTAVEKRALPGTLRDLVALTKPRITLMVVITTAGGMWLAPGQPSIAVIATMLVTTAMVVAGANALNCYLERDSDRLMARTASRPLPDGRLPPSAAKRLGLALGLVSVPALTFGVNALTGLLGAIALVSYVAVYTPMKQSTPTALLVGAIPGALPPLMGWTSVTASLDAPGLVLFGVLFLWQVPHFLAIAIFRQSEYERAGLKVLPSVRGLAMTKRQAAFYTACLVALTPVLYAQRVAGLAYLVVALVAGAVFLGVALAGLRPSAGKRWAKKLFVTSLVYLTALFFALILDAVA